MRRAAKSLLRLCVREAVPWRIEDLDSVERILIVRPNFRIGNMVISTAVIAAFRKRFPSAQIDFLGTDTTTTVLRGQPIDHLHTLSRRFITRPWDLLRLLRRLRGRRYDLVAQLNGGSLTGYLMAGAVGGRVRMGRGKGDRRWYELEVDGRQVHTYDNAVNFARLLGVACPDRPVLHLEDSERAHASSVLMSMLARAPAVLDGSFDAVFVGGRGRKRWPVDAWLQLFREFDAADRPFIVFLGPEERHLGETLGAAIAGTARGHLVHPRPLREFVALMSFARCLVTPDSGPMHLAAGVAVPTISIVTARVSLKFVPRGRFDATLLDPTPKDVLAAVRNVETAGCETRASVREAPIP